MGDPRRLKNKFTRPKRLWNFQRLIQEKTLKKEYGLKNMHELWVASAELKKYRRVARRLLSLGEQERAKEAGSILTKMENLGLLNKDATLDDILSLNIKSILDRRLQTFVYKNGLAKSMRQSRQLITHGWISVSERKVTVPSYKLKTKEEKTVRYSAPIDIEIKKE